MTPSEQLHDLTDQIADAIDAEDLTAAIRLTEQARRLHSTAFPTTVIGPFPGRSPGAVVPAAPGNSSLGDR